MNQFHPFHLVYLSPWPLFMGVLLLSIFFMFLLMMNKFSFYFMFILLLLAILILFNWWRDVNRESTLQGFHTSFVYSNMRYGMLLFIISEFFLFLSFFWSFFHSSLVSTFELGGVWPPPQLPPVSPFDVPLLNTIILVSSGVTVTLCHHYMVLKMNTMSFMYLFFTVLLGVYFTLAQLFEYGQTDFVLSDSSYGSCFFVATGFHGFHVIVGSLMLFFSLLRMKSSFFNYYHHVGLESSIWYWHFVDVIWLYLFLFVYWWAY